MLGLQGWSVAGKSWTALVGALLTLVIPLLLQVSTSLPPPWPAVVGAVVAVLTSVGVYHAPYSPVPGVPPLPPAKGDPPETRHGLP